MPHGWRVPPRGRGARPSVWAWPRGFLPEQTRWEGERKTKSNFRLENLIIPPGPGDQVRFQQLRPQTGLGPAGWGEGTAGRTLRSPSLSLKQWLWVTQGRFCAPGHIWPCPETPLAVTDGAAEHPATHRAAPRRRGTRARIAAVPRPGALVQGDDDKAKPVGSKARSSGAASTPSSACPALPRFLFCRMKPRTVPTRVQ